LAIEESQRLQIRSVSRRLGFLTITSFKLIPLIYGFDFTAVVNANG